MNSFSLTPTLVRELGYLLNGNQHNGWVDRTAEFLGVSPRTVEAWARGERECEGPPALLMAHLASMVTQGTYLDVSIDKIERMVERYGRKTSLDLDHPEVRRSIRSVIKLNSSIKKIAQDLAIDRSALSRWLSGENALGIDGVSKVLNHIGLNRIEDEPYEGLWRINLNWYSLDESSQNLRDAIKLFFPAPPACVLTQIGDLSGRSANMVARLMYKKTALTIEINFPTKLARHSQGLSWIISAFDWMSSLTIYCPLSGQSQLDEANRLNG
ncbi:hypothetical protein [Skermanella aerolata]|uniref:hypothetical protein n=1 Tax=Skermanella aerolata TaxID=393310 RepID=UPI0011BE2BED|nr:hypothetical protein [Skermanella aerolata]